MFSCHVIIIKSHASERQRYRNRYKLHKSSHTSRMDKVSLSIGDLLLLASQCTIKNKTNNNNKTKQKEEEERKKDQKSKAVSYSFSCWIRTKCLYVRLFGILLSNPNYFLKHYVSVYCDRLVLQKDVITWLTSLTRLAPIVDVFGLCCLRASCWKRDLS